LLSVILSTYRPALLETLSRNIADTIGVEYEIIAVDNPGKMGISRAYNIGAEKARFETLCFLHEDVEMLTRDWGKVIIRQMETSNAALIGVAGSNFKPAFISGWTTGIEDYDRVNIFQRGIDGMNYHYHSNPLQETLSPVVVIDGVCMFIRKQVFKRFRFDENISGFHFYDLDLSMRLHAADFKVMVSFAIDLVHFSAGRFDNSWFTEARAFHHNHRTLLPRKTVAEKVSGSIIRRIKMMWAVRLHADGLSKQNLMSLHLNYGMFIVYRLYLKAFSTVKPVFK
jgi:GT2 family glycosyltransferase